jgi:hypothetical protein
MPQRPKSQDGLTKGRGDEGKENRKKTDEIKGGENKGERKRNGSTERGDGFDGAV